MITAPENPEKSLRRNAFSRWAAWGMFGVAMLGLVGLVGLQAAGCRFIFDPTQSAPAQALARFAATIRDEVDIDRLAWALLTVVEETMQPEGASLWLQEYTRKDLHE